MLFLVLTLVMSLFLTVFAVAPVKAAGAVLVVDNPVIAYGQPVSLSGAGFAPGEKIAIWSTDPQGLAETLGYLNASSAGDFTKYVAKDYYDVSTPPGVQRITVQGLTSGVKAYATYTLLTPIVRAIGTDQGSGITAVTFAGAFWFPGEKVSYWITDAAGAVYIKGAQGYVWADTNGFLPASPDDGIPSFRINAPTPLAITFYGATSKQTVLLRQRVGA